jgi:signal transduction histidine kinase
LLCELISSGRKPDLLKNIADNFFNGTQILVKRLEELLDVARFARGAVNLNLEPVDIRRFIDQVVSRYAPSITQRHQSIVTDLSRDLPPVTLDQSRVEQVLINLLSNASKYSPEGASILLSAGICQDELLISVKDEGVGISEEEQSHLFKPYQRLGKEQQKVLGLGLGLTVVKNIVEAHGGRVSLTSKPGQGSIFSFTLPISENHDARTAKPEISESK